jgi:hypothetical protein
MQHLPKRSGRRAEEGRWTAQAQTALFELHVD